MPAIPYPTPLWSRIVSFALASSYSLLLLLYPKAVIGDGGQVSHGGLALLLWGVAAGFVHGVGFVPDHPLWRLVFHPGFSWIVMGGGALLLVS